MSFTNTEQTNGELMARVAMLESKLFDANEEIASLKSRASEILPANVLSAILDEMKYQDDKWGVEHNRSQTVTGHLIILQEKLNNAYHGWMKNLTGRNSVESEITQVAAVAIQALINLDNEGKL